jgi:FAD/FMN-containing dehydrogenase
MNMKKKLLKFLIYFLVIIGALVIGLTVYIKSLGDSNFNTQLNKVLINEVTRAYPVQVASVYTPKETSDIVNLIKTTNGPISIGGGRFSMGGQTATDGAIQIDMRQFDKVISFSKEKKQITVQAGITWRKIQEYIDRHNLSVKIMQTYSNFTVGGSLSVNVHGRYLGLGPLVQSVEGIKVVLANGELVEATPMKNQDLFYSAIGGYGGIGVIVEATLSLDDNVKIERRTSRMKIADFKDYFFKNIRGRKDIIFYNADIYPNDYEDISEVSWYKTDKEVTIDQRIIPKDRNYFFLPKLTKFISTVPFGPSLRKNVIEPFYYLENRVVWRNWEASYDVNELEPGDRSAYTYVLQEYFVPVEKFNDFYPKMKKVFQEKNVNVLNVSIRHAYQDPGTILAWARSEVFAFVVYYKQALDPDSRFKVKEWTKVMIDQVLSVGGSYYLPYQIHASLDQFKRAYPNSDKYFQLKKKYDPSERLQNNLLNAYAPNLKSNIRRDFNDIKNYKKGEELTYLTIPEWYLVFNPQDYVDFLNANNNPSDFPFFASINEYWSYYDRAIALVKNQYFKNDEYITMLNIIGVSTTVEYLIKGTLECGRKAGGIVPEVVVA